MRPIRGVLSSEELMQELLKGDDRCSIPIGSRVEKTNSEPGDYHENGEQGIVTGNIYVDEGELKGSELYLVQFDDTLAPTGIALPVGKPPRIRKIVHSQGEALLNGAL